MAVIVPARNEAANLPALLASLAGQLGPADELVVVDDHSSDGTTAKAVAAGSRVLAAPALPGGWTGKCWACWTGVQSTRGATLLFLDADTTLAPGGLARLRNEHRRHPGLLSVQPDHLTVRPYERLSAPFNIIGMMGVDAFTPLGERLTPRGAFGPCLITTRLDYLAVGGHPAVRGEILEDVALAARFRAAGLGVTCRGGRQTISFRMYPNGTGQLVEGWTKNFASGAAATRPITLALIVTWVAGTILSATGLLRPSPWALGAYLAFAAQQWWMLARIGRFGWWAGPAYPVTTAFFLAVFGRSVFLTTVRREVRWRGRAIRLPARRRGSVP